MLVDAAECLQMLIDLTRKIPEKFDLSGYQTSVVKSFSFLMLLSYSEVLLQLDIATKMKTPLTSLS